MEGELSANRKTGDVNLIPGALGNHGEFDANCAKNACACRGHTQTTSALYIK